MNGNSGNASHTGFCGLMVLRESSKNVYLILRYVFNAYVTRKLS